MWNKVWREVKTVSGSLLTIMLLLIVLFFVLNFVRTRGIPGVSPVAGWAEDHATGKAYEAQAAPIAVAPASGASSNGMGPML